MNELEEFITLLHRHPELIEQLRQIAKDGALRPVSQEKQTEKDE